MKKTNTSATEQETKMPVPVENEPEESKVDATQWFDVGPGETVSICAGNRVLFMGTGITGIMIHQNK